MDDRVVRLVVYIIAGFSIFGIATTLFQPVPATSAYLAMDVATLIAFAYAYQKTKDVFWLIMLAAVPFSLISDLYFLPSFNGLVWPRPQGMNTWQGLHLVVISLGCFIHFRKSSYKYLLLITTVIGVLANVDWGATSLSRGAAGYIAGLAWQAAVFGYLVYYGAKMRKLTFSAGATVQFLGLVIVVWYYFRVSRVDITPITLTWTDKIIAFGRLLTAIGALERLKAKASA